MNTKHLFFLLLFCTSFCFLDHLSAQSCSKESITAKYWQYRKNLKHFVAVDRDSSGCIHDGIGQDSEDPCLCSKAGFGLPATSINIEDTGQPGMGDREGLGVWYDLDCAGDSIGETNNYLDMGSETPHQMGWYWLTLATEYRLLKENNQDAEAQRTLEELFLGLQAYRRLDITANCLARARYQEITDGFEIDADCTRFLVGPIPAPFRPCLCAGKYTGDSQWAFNVGCRQGCTYTPNTSGFSGFFLREDATQALEGLLHDDSEGKWNIDLVGGNGYAMSLNPPCTTTFSQACYLEHRRGFMSQDGVFALMIGLAMIKKFIPPTATVTTCDGATYSPLSIATQIATGMTDRIDNDYKNQIVWPQSRMCCDREVALTSEEGGRLIFSIHGLKKACSYIDGEERHSSAGEAALWGGFAAQSAGFFWGENVRHWVRLKTIGWDMGSAGNGGNYMAALDDKNLEIMRFINNLLYPAQPDIGIDKAFFKSMLCDAPCGGPCRKRSDYGDTIAGYANFPEFECPNNPNWIGQRWEEHGNGDTGANRQFNGLDFMALYNLYLLYFPEERTAYFNPDRPQGDIAWGSSNIEGPGVLCPVDTARYKLLHPQPSYVQNLVWTASTNFEVLVSQGLEADIAAKSTIYTPQFVQTSFGENRQIPQFYDGLPGYIDTSGVHAYGDIIDVCDLDYRKIVYTRTPNYTIETEFDHCNADYWFHAVGISPDIPNTTYTWKFG